ncbi:type II toxin-antitoxin system RelE/ParE family toxin [Methanocalculus taiwanensis]|uniref:Type II toxin-antitoxin system RelE/ParE family toxin n=1 Tax=Methanocalculus taiwanensis TaxID=106207 RepID=A0ABD4TLQ1_9EURY|nr:type II toxin-antitoxin system RelE/ParE family toxin [Methanocalculus taiwanensis]
MNLYVSSNVKSRYRVEITTVAERDIEEIWEYISQDNAERATASIFDLEKSIAGLSTLPLRCSLVPENEILGTAYRHLLYGNYRIIFRVFGSKAIILRVVHKGRLLDTRFFC